MPRTKGRRPASDGADVGQRRETAFRFCADLHLPKMEVARGLFDGDGDAPPHAQPAHDSGAAVLLRRRRPRPLGFLRDAHVLRSTKAMLVLRLRRVQQLERRAADVLSSNIAVLNLAAYQGGAMFPRHETALGVRVQLADRCREEQRVSERAECSTDTTGGRIVDVGRRACPSDADTVRVSCEPS